MNWYFTGSLFLKTASGFIGRCSDELIFPTSNFDFETVEYFNKCFANLSNSICVICECSKLNIVKNYCCSFV